MKKIISGFTILIFLTLNAQYNTGVVYFKDSTQIKGLIKKRQLGGIKFKKKKKSNVSMYNHKHISRFDIKDKKYRYVIYKNFQ